MRMGSSMIRMSHSFQLIGPIKVTLKWLHISDR